MFFLNTIQTKDKIVKMNFAQVTFKRGGNLKKITVLKSSINISFLSVESKFILIFLVFVLRHKLDTTQIYFLHGAQLV